MSDPTPRSVARRRRSRLRLALLVGVVVVLGAAGGVIAATQGGGSGGSSHQATATTLQPTSSSSSADVHVDLGALPMRSATTKGSDLTVYSAPASDAKPIETLAKITEYKQPRTLLAFDQYQDFLRVYLPTRPNSSTGWVKASDVNLSGPLDYQIKVSLAQHKLWLIHNGQVQLEAGTAIGATEYPTPTGTFYITDPVDLRADPTGPYGAYALGLSGHSDVLTEFAGSDGQIAIHGTPNPSDIGKDVSHGCVRVTNDTILKLSTLPLGTPVIIT